MHRVPEFDQHGRVLAAGGVILHGGRVCVIHRPRYEDWSLPKGKLDAGEDFQTGALREVWEETGLTATCGDELTPHEYVDRKHRPKLVRWWRMTIDADTPFVVNDEVDERRWVTPGEAEQLLDYEHDRALVREAVGATG
ncbi:MAG: NUDIX hydrolase [Solirubrobacterales bacterium]|nr:NUDIX hydrolase [Solirubrobacterales bacterium]